MEAEYNDVASSCLHVPCCCGHIAVVLISPASGEALNVNSQHITEVTALSNQQSAT